MPKPPTPHGWFRNWIETIAEVTELRQIACDLSTNLDPEQITELFAPEIELTTQPPKGAPCSSKTPKE
jgi:hypothetical protein